MDKTEQIRSDFDEIAVLADPGESGSDRYDALLLSLVPPNTKTVLDIGCGLGRLTQGLANDNREVLGVDLSPTMIKLAQSNSRSGRVSFLVGDFLDLDFNGRAFDFVVSAAALHHMPCDKALMRMVDLTRSGGRLVIHDVRRDINVSDSIRAFSALAQTMFARLVRTGRLRPPKRLREAWARHGAAEEYLSLHEAQSLAGRYLPGAQVLNHWLWRYTMVWDKPQGA